MAYESATMGAAEIEAFMTDTRHAIIATNRTKGPPQLSPVWYLYRDGAIYVSIGRGSAKYRNLRRDPRISLLVDGAYPDARYVVIYGTAAFVEETSTWRDIIEKAIYMRYHETEEEAERYRRETSDPDAVLLVITPQKVISQNYN